MRHWFSSGQRQPRLAGGGYSQPLAAAAFLRDVAGIPGDTRVWLPPTAIDVPSIDTPTPPADVWDTVTARLLDQPYGATAAATDPLAAADARWRDVVAQTTEHLRRFVSDAKRDIYRQLVPLILQVRSNPIVRKPTSSGQRLTVAAVPGDADGAAVHRYNATLLVTVGALDDPDTCCQQLLAEFESAE